MAGQNFVTGSLGGNLTNNKLTKQARHLAQPLMKIRQFTRPEPAAGKRGGDKVYYDIFSNVATAGGTLSEVTTIPKTNQTISQGTLTLVEYGNSIPYTEKLESLGDISISENIRTGLINDMAKVLDSAAATQFKTSDYKATIKNTASTVFASAGSPSSQAGANMSDKNVRDIVDKMRILNIPTFDSSGNYIFIHSVNSIRGLYDFFEAKAQQTTMAPLASGEVGQYYQARHILETSALDNSVGTSSYGEALAFGADAVRQGVAVLEEIRTKIPTDFGRDKGLAWYALLGFNKTWDFTRDAQTRIIHITSS